MGQDMDVRAAVEEFVARVSGLQVAHTERVPIASLSRRRAFRDRPWYHQPGVYVFYNGRHEMRYVGRALIGVGGISARICDHVKPRYRGDPDWDAVLDDAGAWVEVWSFANDDEAWVPALELFLTGRFRPLLLNRRAG